MQLIERTNINKSQAYTWIFLIPLLCFFMAMYYAPSWGAFYDGLNSDPEYVYLFNSLNILNGVSPKHVDHPGTTLQLLGAGVILVTSLFDASHLTITEKVLSDPEKYLTVIRHVLNSLILVSWILLSYSLVSKTRKTWLLVPLNAGILATTAIYVSMQRVSAEPLLVSITLLLGYLLIEFYFNGAWKRALPILLGITLAAGLVTKVTFAPLLLLIFVFDKRIDKLIALLSLLAASVLLTTPIWSEVSRMTQWLIDIAMHSGRYGGGETGLPSAQHLLDNFGAIKSGLYFMLLTLVFIVVFVLMPTASVRRRKLYLIAFLVIAAQILITLKHPGEHYLLPSQIFSAVIFTLLVREFSKVIPIVIIGAIPFMAWFLFVSVTNFDSNVNHRTASQKSFLTLVQNAQSMECKIVPYYRSGSIAYALGFGNRFVRHQYADTLSGLYPDFISYDYWDRGFEDYYQLLPTHEPIPQLHGVSRLCFIGSLDLNKKYPQAKLVSTEGIYKLYTLGTPLPGQYKTDLY